MSPRKYDDKRAHSPAFLVYLLLLLTASNALNYADRQLFAILAPAIKAEFGMSDAMVGLLGGPAFMVSFVLCSIPLARLADRWSRGKVLAISISLFSIMTAACGIAANSMQMLAARIGIGIGEAGGSPPAQSVIASHFSEKRRSTALSIFACGTYIGVVTSMWGGALLAEHIGWRMTFILLALPGLIIALLIFFAVPKRSAPIAASKDGPGMIEGLKQFWKVPTYRHICTGAGFLGIFSYVTSTWMPSYFIRSHELPLVEAGFWIGVGGTAGGIIGTMTSGLLADRLSQKSPRWQLLIPALGVISATPVFMVQLLIPSGSSLTLGGAQIPWVVIPVPVSAALMGLWMPPCFAAIISLFPAEKRAQATAMFITILTVVGAGIGPLFAGALSDTLTPVFGVEALRYAILATLVTLAASAACFGYASRFYVNDLNRQS